MHNGHAVSERQALLLSGTLFFLWGLTMNLISALEDPLSAILCLAPSSAALMQTSYYAAYFTAALPASVLAQRAGFKAAMERGLALFVAGLSFCAISLRLESYPAFLAALFICALGAATLETASNPYVAQLGAPQNAASRLTLAQGLNGAGTVLGPILISCIAAASEGTSFCLQASWLYAAAAIAAAGILIVFFRHQLPHDSPHHASAAPASFKEAFCELRHAPAFLSSTAAEFLFIGLQVTGMARFSSFVQEGGSGIGASDASVLLVVLSLAFCAGRFMSASLLSRHAPSKVLALFMGASAALFVQAAFLPRSTAAALYILAYLFVSIGYPTIYALALRGLSEKATKLGASILTMSCIGAAILPPLAAAASISAGDAATPALLAGGFAALCIWAAQQ